MNELIKPGEVFSLAELVPYRDGKIVNMDVAANEKMKLALMAFDAGTGLSEHAAPGEAILFFYNAVRNPVTYGFFPFTCEKYAHSVIEVVTHCHTQFGRKNNRRLPIENYNFFKEASIPLAKARTMSPEELEGRIVCGEFVNKDVPEYTEQYRKLVIDKVRG